MYKVKEINSFLLLLQYTLYYKIYKNTTYCVYVVFAHFLKWNIKSVSEGNDYDNDGVKFVDKALWSPGYNKFLQITPEFSLKFKIFFKNT